MNANQVIDLQQGDGCPSSCCQAKQNWPLPTEVIIPVVRSRVVDESLMAGVWIDGSDIWAFAVIAAKACERKVFKFGRSIQLLWDNVIHFKRRPLEHRRHLAVFAPRLGTLPNAVAELLGDRHELASRRAILARD